jgi:hypothetical protein
MWRRLALPVFSLIATVAASSVLAGTFCVSTVGGIQSALTIAVSNGESDTINVVGGNYSLAAPLTFDSAETRALTIEGGWNAGCTSRTGAETVLSGQSQVAILDLFNVSGNLGIVHLTLVSGRSTASLGSPIEISSNTGDVLVELNQFIGNRSFDGIGAVSAYAGSGHLRFRNNLLVGNRGAFVGAAFLVQDSGEAWVTGNTVVGNVADQTVTTGGLAIAGNGHFTLSNNIFWNNAGTANFDFNASSAHSRYNNDIGFLGSGTPADQIDAEQYVDPLFESCAGFLCLNFKLSGRSPLVNAGVDAPAGGQSAADLAGSPRKIGVHVDIGAYESDVLFADDFE